MKEYTTLSQRCKKEFREAAEETIKEDRLTLEKKIKLILKHMVVSDLKYNYNLSKKYSLSELKFYESWDFRLKDYKKIKDNYLFILNNLGYYKLDKKSFILFINTLNKSLQDFDKYLDTIDIKAMYIKLKNSDKNI